MVDGLPHHIEAYLKEANFSSTEILVLKRLLQDDALTLRELSMKTGKSAGVLDQALKKLNAKHIISRDGINDTTKYSIKNLDAVLVWMQRDVEKKHTGALSMRMWKEYGKNILDVPRSICYTGIVWKQLLDFYGLPAPERLLKRTLRVF